MPHRVKSGGYIGLGKLDSKDTRGSHEVVTDQVITRPVSLPGPHPKRAAMPKMAGSYQIFGLNGMGKTPILA